MENLKEMKQWLKENGALIKESKIEMKTAMRSGNYAGCIQNDLIMMKRIYRQRHIAYSMARGKTYEQIESSTPRADDLNWTLINNMIETLTPQLEEAS